MFAVHTMHKVGDTSFRTSHGSNIDFYLRTSGMCEPNSGVLNIGGTRTRSAKNPDVRTTGSSAAVRDLRLGVDEVEESILPIALEATTARHMRDPLQLASGKVKKAEFVMAVERAMQENAVANCAGCRTP